MARRIWWVEPYSYRSFPSLPLPFQPRQLKIVSHIYYIPVGPRLLVGGKCWDIYPDQTVPDQTTIFKTHIDRKFSSASLFAPSSAFVPAVGQSSSLVVEGSPDNVPVILLTMVALIMLLMMLAEYVDPSEILRSSKHHMVIIEGW